MLQKMEAEILFLDPADRDPCIAALKAHGFEVEIFDWIDDYGPTVWIMGRTDYDDAGDRFSDWVLSLVEPLGGDVVEAGLANPQQVA
jgi:hypothetical protein